VLVVTPVAGPGRADCGTSAFCCDPWAVVCCWAGSWSGECRGWLIAVSASVGARLACRDAVLSVGPRWSSGVVEYWWHQQTPVRVLLSHRASEWEGPSERVDGPAVGARRVCVSNGSGCLPVRISCRLYRSESLRWWYLMSSAESAVCRKRRR